MEAPLTSIVFDEVDIASSSGAHFVATSANSSSSLLRFASSSASSSVSFLFEFKRDFESSWCSDVWTRLCWLMRAPLLTIESGSNGCEGGAANDLLSLASSNASIVMNSSASLELLLTL